MTIDGEWRTSENFMGDPPAVNYMTAPFPVPDANADMYGMGQVGGTIIGIPKGAPHPEEAWLLVSWMATDTPTLVYMANTVRNVPTTLEALSSPDLDVTPQFQTFLDIFANPNSHYKETSAIGQADQDLMASFMEKWQAGKVDDLQAGLDDVAKQINDQLAQAAGAVREGRIIASSNAADAAAGIRARRPRPRRRRTHWPTVLLFMSPWIIGFSVFIVYPMVSSLYFSFTHYDLIGSPIWIGLDNYKYMFTEDALFWQAIRNTVWFIVVAVPLQIVFAIFTASLLTRPRRGVKVYRTLFFLPAIAPLVAAALAFLFLFNPSYGAGQPRSSRPWAWRTRRRGSTPRPRRSGRS